MTMVMDNQPRQYGGMAYEHMYPHGLQSAGPQFTDPWSAHSAANTSSSVYPTAHPMPPQPKPESTRPTAISLPYSSIPVSAPSVVAGSSYPAAGYGTTDLLSAPQDIPRTTYGTDPSYATSSPATSTYPPTTYPSLSYAQSLQAHQQQQQHNSRKSSNEVDGSRAAQATFGELDSARGMLALSHQNVADLTPRNIYEARAQRGSTDSYGFPSHHSSVSSISSHSRDYPYYSAPSVASVDSATDYSSAASESGYESVNSRTLPPPPQLLGANLPPAPQSMMGQFSSKMSSNTQKKHKCKICDKRFTRPSSLQTHMYSHTGEKLVSNLRRHKKVHKNGGDVDQSHSDSED
ncbi:MAG: hypothetical protein Q9227_009152 [Pyrenula ochraceoflavens]